MPHDPMTEIMYSISNWGEIMRRYVHIIQKVIFKKVILKFIICSIEHMEAMKQLIRLIPHVMMHSRLD